MSQDNSSRGLIGIGWATRKVPNRRQNYLSYLSVPFRANQHRRNLDWYRDSDFGIHLDAA